MNRVKSEVWAGRRGVRGSPCLMDGRRIHPPDPRDPRTWIAVAVTKNRAKEERILCTGKVGTAANDQLELPFQNQAELLPLMLDGVFAAALGRDSVDIGFQQNALPKGHKPLVLDPLATSQRVDIEHRPAAGAGHDFALRGIGKKIGKGDFKRFGNSLERG